MSNTKSSANIITILCYYEYNPKSVVSYYITIDIWLKLRNIKWPWRVPDTRNNVWK